MNNMQLLKFCEAGLGIPMLGVWRGTTFYHQVGWMSLSKSIPKSFQGLSFLGVG